MTSQATNTTQSSAHMRKHSEDLSSDATRHSSPPSAQTGGQATAQPSIESVLAESFPPFDHAQISEQLAEDDRKYDETMKKCAEKIVDILHELHIMGIARFEMEMANAAAGLTRQMDEAHDMELEEGRSPHLHFSPTSCMPPAPKSFVERARARLEEFHTFLQRALAAFHPR